MGCQPFIRKFLGMVSGHLSVSPVVGLVQKFSGPILYGSWGGRFSSFHSAALKFSLRLLLVVGACLRIELCVSH